MSDRANVSVTVLLLGYKIATGNTHVYYIWLPTVLVDYDVVRHCMYFMMMAACFYHLDLL